MKILVVEDDEKGRYLACFLLRRAGFDVLEARDGQEAIKKAAERPDLILMDMQLPVIDGYEATRRIRADEDLARIPVIALTAYAMKGDREKTLEAGCSGYIEKPIDPKQFVSQVREYL